MLVCILQFIDLPCNSYAFINCHTNSHTEYRLRYFLLHRRRPSSVFLPLAFIFTWLDSGARHKIMSRFGRTRRHGLTLSNSLWSLVQNFKFNIFFLYWLFFNQKNILTAITRFICVIVNIIRCIHCLYNVYMSTWKWRTFCSTFKTLKFPKTNNT